MDVSKKNRDKLAKIRKGVADGIPLAELFEKSGSGDAESQDSHGFHLDGAPPPGENDFRLNGECSPYPESLEEAEEWLLRQKNGKTGLPNHDAKSAGKSAGSSKAAGPSAEIPDPGTDHEV